MEANITSTLSQFIKLLHVAVSRETASKTLESHPDFPSLYSISNALDLWNIENAAFRLSSVDQLYDLPTPFIVHTKQKGGWFKIITNVKGNKIHFWDSSQGTDQQIMADFISDFNDVVLIAETNINSGEIIDRNGKLSNFFERITPTLTYVLALIAIIIISLKFVDYNVSNNWVMLVSKTLGLTASIMLIMKQIGNKNSFLEKLCHIRSKTNCDNLLNRPEAKIFGWLSWSEVGLIYFGGGIISLLIDIDNVLLIWLAIFAASYTLYSLYVQAFVAKIWCPLCLFVQSVLLFEFVFSVQSNKTLPELENFLYLTLSFVLPFAFILAIKPILDKAQKLDEVQKNLTYFSRRTSVFSTLLNDQPVLGELPENLKTASIGPNEAPYVLTLITNPYCSHCKERHKEIENLLGISKKFKVQIVFLTSGAEDDKVTTIVQHLLALDGTIFHQALSDWFSYSPSNYKKWAKKYPIDVNINDYKQLALDHGLWCWNEGLTGSPILFLNDRRLPDVYELKDLDWLLPGLTNNTSELIQFS